MNDKKTPIQKVLHQYPNANFSLQTPIQFLKSLSAKLGCNVYVKREDLTGFALGGNKVRKLDFLIGDATKKKADVLVTKYATSFSRNASAACKVCNLDLHVFIMGAKEEQNIFSQVLFQQYETKLHYISEQKEEILNESYERCVQQLKDQGKKAVKLFADLEGILLDQVYTGKAAAGMMHYAESGQFKDNDNILFIHTGGNAGTYY